MATATVPHDTARLGSVEARVLGEVRRNGGLVPRDALMEVVFPGVGPRPPLTTDLRDLPHLEGWRARRANAQSAVSRAISSLQAKGLLVIERTSGGRTLLREPAVTVIPPWEQAARSDEEMAARCLQLARELRTMARRARDRATSVRDRRSDAGTLADRAVDVRRIGDIVEAFAPPRSEGDPLTLLSR